MSQYHLIYDDACALCRKAADGVRKLDRLGLVCPVPLSDIDTSSRTGSAYRRLREQVHLVTPEGKVYRGAEAVGVLSTLFPSSKFVGNLILLPGVRVLARLAYRLVAKHRLKLSRLSALN